MKVLAIGCHPDDLEIACGGTLRKYVENGAEVTMCHVANGDQGHVVIISSGAGSAWQRADGTVAAPGSFPDGHWIVFYYYADGIFYANDSSVAAKQGAGCPYNEEQMQQWLSGRGNHFAVAMKKR